MACCKEWQCRRRAPMLLRHGELSGAWYLVTRSKKDGSAIVMQERHDVTTEVQNYVIATVLQDLVGKVDRKVLDDVAAKWGLSPKQPFGKLGGA